MAVIPVRQELHSIVFDCASDESEILASDRPGGLEYPYPLPSLIGSISLTNVPIDAFFYTFHIVYVVNIYFIELGEPPPGKFGGQRSQKKIVNFVLLLTPNNTK